MRLMRLVTRSLARPFSVPVGVVPVGRTTSDGSGSGDGRHDSANLRRLRRLPAARGAPAPTPPPPPPPPRRVWPARSGRHAPLGARGLVVKHAEHPAAVRRGPQQVTELI